MNVPAALLAVVFLLPAVRACDPGGGSTTPDPDPVDVDPVELDAVVSPCTVSETDPVSIDEAYFEYGELVVGFSYDGGCEDHELELCWAGDWIKTSPMKVGLELRHDANGDACRMQIVEERSFDLSVIKDETLTGFPGETGVWLLLADESHWYGF